MDRLQPCRELARQERQRREHEHEDHDRLGDDHRQHVGQDRGEGVAEACRRKGDHHHGRDDQGADLQIEAEPPRADENPQDDARDDDGEPDRQVGHEI